jgi:four helix bundle protein
MYVRVVSKAEPLVRTKTFGLRILNLVDDLPRIMSGRAIGSQLVRSGTSIGADYRAACRSRSRAEFAAKLGIVAEERMKPFTGWKCCATRS